MLPAVAGPGRPEPLGLTPEGDGANVAVFSEGASAIELCVFDPAGRREVARLPLPERTGSIWHGHVSPLPIGTLYGLRASGPWAPERGERYNPAKLLLDPYARAIQGTFDAASPLLVDHDPARGEQVACSRDSAAVMPKAVFAPLPEPVPDEEYPRLPWGRTVIYEAHVRGLTMQHPDVPQALRGTYEALGCPAIIAHLQALGVTAIELLPVHLFVDDGRLLGLGLRNYWGYNTIGFFAPEPRYFGPNGAEGLREAIRALHAAGIEVMLDVVYNHTAEGDQRGPTMSFRGLDNLSYYRLLQGRMRRYVNDTGCGNTVNAGHPQVIRLILDSLRFWVQRYGIDGFRFDLGTALAREEHGFDAHGGFLDALLQDPVLSRVKLIMEPWDIGPGGYRLGGFPAPIAEWNDQCRDTVRRFWKREPHAAPELAERLLGSAGLFDGAGRRAWSSINFVACHDGFTLADVTAYNAKHNEANREGNHDGHGANYSDNCGVEGPTDDPEVLARRGRRRRNLLTTVFLSQGTPMLLAGDEIGNSQSGNNNAYCQDNPIGWVDWTRTDNDLLAFVCRLTALRRSHPCLRQEGFLHSQKREADGLSDVEWAALDGNPVAWRDPGLESFRLILRCSAEAPAYADCDDTVLIAVNGGTGSAPLALPRPPEGRVWHRVLDTAAPEAPDLPCKAARQMIEAESIAVFTLGSP